MRIAMIGETSIRSFRTNRNQERNIGSPMFLRNAPARERDVQSGATTMNHFDAAVLIVVLILAILGFRAGLLRSLADILGFVIAAPLAVALTPYFSPAAAGRTAVASSPFGTGSLMFFGLFLIGGLLLAQLMRQMVAGLAGDDIPLFDRCAGLVLGPTRAFLVAVTIVLIFDRIIPSGYDPEFLRGSKTRPWLSLAAQRGLKSLPPETTDYIDRLKRERGL
jgi:membrane protein required for colicin V production